MMLSILSLFPYTQFYSNMTLAFLKIMRYIHNFTIKENTVLMGEKGFAEHTKHFINDIKKRTENS